ncbi:MAG TPA: hypothetical protein VJN88_14120 [Ktedonobacterales bacterium]|nr:hypothetical protein [Ktedonobacterales bacterium]
MSESDNGDLSRDDTEDGAASTLEPLLARRLTHRQRLLRMAVIAGAPLLVLAVILGTTAISAQRRQLALNATATVLHSPAYAHVYLDVEVPWLRVTLDGRAITPPTLYQQPPIALTPGLHTLAWQADPFAAHECAISMPPVDGDSCNGYVIGMFYGQRQPPARVLHLGEALSTVEPGYRVALTQAIQAALTASGGSDTVRPGEQYLVDGQGLVTANKPLTATLNLTAQLSETSNFPDNCRSLIPSAVYAGCTVDTANCADICAMPYENRITMASAAHEWLAVVPYAPSYTYTTPDGQVVAAGQPLEFSGRGVGAQLAVLGVSWDGANWRVRMIFGPNTQTTTLIQGQTVGGNPVCLAADDMFSGGLDVQTFSTFGRTRVVSAANPAQGCVAQGVVGARGATPTPDAPQALFLERFGIYYAANDLAHSDEIGLPVASPAEQALAAQIAAQPGQTFGS